MSTFQQLLQQEKNSTQKHPSAPGGDTGGCFTFIGGELSLEDSTVCVNNVVDLSCLKMYAASETGSVSVLGRTSRSHATMGVSIMFHVSSTVQIDGVGSPHYVIIIRIYTT